MESSNRGRLATVLLVEDNPDDVLLLRHSFDRANLSVDLLHVESGQDCMRLLRNEGEYAEAPRPDLILLDLNLPGMNGREVLSEIVQDENLRSLPVVVLTTSDNERDVVDMYRLRCNSYITKPVDFDQFQQVVRDLGNYWFTLSVLPSAR